MCLNNQALADVRSTGAGIKCLYCKLLQAWSFWMLLIGYRPGGSIEYLCRGERQYVMILWWGILLSVIVISSKCHQKPFMGGVE